MTISLNELATAVRLRRGNLATRDAAKHIGVSAATLSRVENEKPPDLATFAKLCRWLGEDPAHYLNLPSSSENHTAQRIDWPAIVSSKEIETLAGMIVRAHHQERRDAEIFP